MITRVRSLAERSHEKNSNEALHEGSRCCSLTCCFLCLPKCFCCVLNCKSKLSRTTHEVLLNS